MENTIKFKYNGKIWNPKNPEKKLKQLGITWDDVEIIKEEIKEEKKEEYMNPVLYEFKNIKTFLESTICLSKVLRNIKQMAPKKRLREATLCDAQPQVKFS